MGSCLNQCIGGLGSHISRQCQAACAIAALAMTLAAAPALADTITFQDSVSPSATYSAPDTHIRSDQPNGNFAGNNEIIVGTLNQGGRLRGLLEFDLTELSNMGAVTIDSAELTMRSNGGGQSNSVTIDLHDSAPFDATAATWNDPDGDGDASNDTDGGVPGALLSSLMLDPSGSAGFHTFDDTPAFRTAIGDALAATDNTLYLLMKRNNEALSPAQSFVRWDSAHPNNATDFHPELIINFSSAEVPEPASIAIWSMLGLGLAGFGYFRFRRSKQDC